MFQSRPISGFFLRLLVLYVLLMVLWPVLAASYGQVYRAVANWIFGSPYPGAEVRVVSYASEGDHPSAENRMWDTKVVLLNRRSRMGGEMPFNIRYGAYVPTSLLVALVVATPIPWRRRGRALVWGLLLMHVYIALRLAVTILNLLCGDTPVALFALSPFWQCALACFREVFSRSVVTVFIIPVVLWTLVTFRRCDWQRFCGSAVSDA